MKATDLTYRYNGKGYSQVLALKKQGAYLYKSAADNLVASADGGIVLRLNYGSDREYPHELKRLGSKFLMVPRFTNFSSKYHSLSSAAGNLIDYTQLFNLWKFLRYPTEELRRVTAATSEEIVAAWLVTSRITIDHFTNLIEYQRYVASKIVATDQDNLHKDHIFSCLRNGVSEIPQKTSPFGHNVIMYIEEKDRFVEWLSVRLVKNRLDLILDSETFVRVKNPIAPYP